MCQCYEAFALQMLMKFFSCLWHTLPYVVCSHTACCVVQVYAVYFKTNRHLIREYPNLRNYTAEIYQMPGKCLAGIAVYGSACMEYAEVAFLLL